MWEENQKTATKPSQDTASGDISSYATTSIVVQNKAVLNLLALNPKRDSISTPKHYSKLLTSLDHSSVQLMLLLLRTHIIPCPATCQKKPWKTAKGNREFHRRGTFQVIGCKDNFLHVLLPAKVKFPVSIRPSLPGLFI